MSQRLCHRQMNPHVEGRRRLGGVLCVAQAVVEVCQVTGWEGGQGRRQKKGVGMGKAGRWESHEKA